MTSKDSGNVPDEKSSINPLQWSKFGLSDAKAGATGVYQQVPSSDQSDTVKELFHEHAENSGTTESNQPWWKANFFVREPVLFGAWDGAFTSTMMNIFGVIVFLRTGWLVAEAGVPLSMLIICLCVGIAALSLLSAVGVCARLHIEAGGVYFLLSHVLGARIGSTIGVVYSFAQAVGCALYCTGFAESVALYLGLSQGWITRCLAAATLLVLLAINVAGVKWVVKVQLVLLCILAMAVLDLVIGSLVHIDPKVGLMGYRWSLLAENIPPRFSESSSFFITFGVFFSTVTGIMAGLNMSGDLKDPANDIPKGSFAAIGVSFVLYFLHVIILGSVCTRDALLNDSLIQEKVALIGFLWLFGLYISSLSACLGGLYGAPRVLQCIAAEKNLPLVGNLLAVVRGVNREPLAATIFIGCISCIFIFVGHINFLSTIVTLPFLLTYAFVNYAYFSLTMSYDNMMRLGCFDEDHDQNEEDAKAYGAVSDTKSHTASPGKSITVNKDRRDSAESLLTREPDLSSPRKSRNYYTYFCNRWLSLAGSLICFGLMFLTQWLYALILFTLSLLLYIYVGQTNPGVYPGVSNFQFFPWLQHVLVAPFTSEDEKGGKRIICSSPARMPDLTTSQQNDENDDFEDRDRYHQSTNINANSITGY